MKRIAEKFSTAPQFQCSGKALLPRIESHAEDFHPTPVAQVTASLELLCIECDVFLCGGVGLGSDVFGLRVTCGLGGRGWKRKGIEADIVALVGGEFAGCGGDHGVFGRGCQGGEYGAVGAADSEQAATAGGGEEELLFAVGKFERGGDVVDGLRGLA